MCVIYVFYFSSVCSVLSHSIYAALACYFFFTSLVFLCVTLCDAHTNKKQTSSTNTLSVGLDSAICVLLHCAVVSFSYVSRSLCVRFCVCVCIFCYEACCLCLRLNVYYTGVVELNNNKLSMATRNSQHVAA